MFLALRITKLVYESQSFKMKTCFLVNRIFEIKFNLNFKLSNNYCHREANISGAKHINSHTKKYEEANTVSLMRN